MLISFEGIKGSGKSTIIQRLSNLIAGTNYIISSPREHTKKFLSENPMSDRAELLVHLADTVDLQTRYAQAYENSSTIVLQERSFDTYIAQSSNALSLDISFLEGIKKQLNIKEPDLVIWLDADPLTALQRGNTKEILKEDLRRAAQEAFMYKVLFQNKKNYIYVDADASVEEVLVDVYNILCEKGVTFYHSPILEEQ